MCDKDVVFIAYRLVMPASLLVVSHLRWLFPSFARYFFQKNIIKLWRIVWIDLMSSLQQVHRRNLYGADHVRKSLFYFTVVHLKSFNFIMAPFPFSNGHFPMDRYGSFLAPFFDRNDGWISYINSTALNRPTEVAVDLIKRIWWPWSRATSSWDPTRTRSISLTVSFNPFKWVVVDISWLYFHPTLLYCAVVVFNINCYRQMDRLGHNLDLCQHQWNSCNV